MASLKETFGIYFCGIKLFSEADGLCVLKYTVFWATGSTIKKLCRDGGRYCPTAKYMNRTDTKYCSTKAEAVPLGLVAALGRASWALTIPESLLTVVIQLELKDALFSWIIPQLAPHRCSRGDRINQLVHKTSALPRSDLCLAICPSESASSPSSPWGVWVTKRAFKYEPWMQTSTFPFNCPQIVQ